MVNVLAVALGGAIGSTLRYGVNELLGSRLRGEFPLATFLVNVSGAFLLGVVLTLAVERTSVTHWWRLFLCVGVLGGYTTFSTLSYETVELIAEGAYATAAVNAAGSLAAGLVAVAAGIWVGRLL